MNHYEFFNLDRDRIDPEQFERALREAYINKLFELGNRRIALLSPGNNLQDSQALIHADADRAIYANHLLSHPETKNRYDATLSIADPLSELLNDHERSMIQWDTIHMDHAYAKIHRGKIFGQYLVGQIDLSWMNGVDPHWTRISNSFDIEFNDTGESIAFTNNFGIRVPLDNNKTTALNFVFKKSFAELTRPINQKAPNRQASEICDRYEAYQMARIDFERELQQLESRFRIIYLSREVLDRIKELYIFGPLGQEKAKEALTELCDAYQAEPTRKMQVAFDSKFGSSTRIMFPNLGFPDPLFRRAQDLYRFGPGGVKQVIQDLATACQYYENNLTEDEQRHYDQQYERLRDSKALGTIDLIDTELYEQAFNLYCFGPGGQRETEHKLNRLCDHYEAERGEREKQQIKMELKRLYNRGSIARIDETLKTRLIVFSRFNFSRPAQTAHSQYQANLPQPPRHSSGNRFYPG
jgi:hypothetical protein